MAEPPSGTAATRPGGGNPPATGAATTPVRAAVVALPDGLASRIGGGERTLALSGSLGAPRQDGTAVLRTASGDVVLRLPADGAAQGAAGRTVALTLLLSGAAPPPSAARPLPAVLHVPTPSAPPAAAPAPSAGAAAAASASASAPAAAPPTAAARGPAAPLSPAPPASGPVPGSGAALAATYGPGGGARPAGTLPAAGPAAPLPGAGSAPGPTSPALFPQPTPAGSAPPAAGGGAAGGAVFDRPPAASAPPSAGTAGRAAAAAATQPTPQATPTPTPTAAGSGERGPASAGTAPGPARPGPAPTTMPTGDSALRAAILTASEAAGGARPSPGAAPGGAATGVPSGALASFGRSPAPSLPPLFPSAASGAEAGRSPLPATERILAELIRLDPAIARQTLQTVLPRPDGGLAGALLLFLSVARGGDVRGWLGERAHRTLESAGRADSLARLGAEFAQQGRVVADPATGDWRSFALPLYDDGQLSALRLHVRGRDADDSAAGGTRGGDGARFLIDLDLSRLGPLQLDGTIRRQRFGLVLRSRRPLAVELRQDLAATFAQACAACGFDGAMTFDADPGRWVRIGDRRPVVDA